jgi:hypothetical protein
MHLFRSFLPVAISMALSTAAAAQGDIDAVIVETYYRSDASDATDLTGGGLAAGSTTYRVYLDLCEGCSLRALYGDANHPLHISTTTTFFNHLDRGRAYGHQISNGWLDEGTVAVESWLALGGASNQRFGVLKTDDPDGSLVGGANNDGGSEAVAGGLLINSDGAIGIPLTQSDGLMAVDGVPVLPPQFNVLGDDPVAVFGDRSDQSSFMSTDVRVGCSTPGVVGPTAANQVLVAQLTTTGELSFALNVEVQRPNGDVVRYVASDDVLLEGETAFGQLNYPPQCGCTDPNFLEYDPAAGCDDGSCATTIVFGCLDTLACNFDPSANFNIAQLCCYGPGNCNGLDVSLICPDVSVDELVDLGGLTVSPNPASTTLRVALPGTTRSVEHWVSDLSGRVLRQGPLVRERDALGLDVADLPSGVYLLVVITEQGRYRARFVKS